MIQSYMAIAVTVVSIIVGVERLIVQLRQIFPQKPKQ